jgi:hypothetical protein
MSGGLGDHALKSLEAADFDAGSSGSLPTFLLAFSLHCFILSNSPSLPLAAVFLNSHLDALARGDDGDDAVSQKLLSKDKDVFSSALLSLELCAQDLSELVDGVQTDLLTLHLPSSVAAVRNVARDAHAVRNNSLRSVMSRIDGLFAGTASRKTAAAIDDADYPRALAMLRAGDIVRQRVSSSLQALHALDRWEVLRKRLEAALDACATADADAFLATAAPSSVASSNGGAIPSADDGSDAMLEGDLPDSSPSPAQQPLQPPLGSLALVALLLRELRFSLTTLSSALPRSEVEAKHATLDVALKKGVYVVVHASFPFLCSVLVVPVSVHAFRFFPSSRGFLLYLCSFLSLCR